MKPIYKNDAALCPRCNSVLSLEEGELDQSGESYLPTKVYRCLKYHCEYAHYLASKEPWQKRA